MVLEHSSQRGVAEKVATLSIKMVSALWSAMRQMPRILQVEMLLLGQWFWKFLKVEVAALMVIMSTLS